MGACGSSREPAEHDLKGQYLPSKTFCDTSAYNLWMWKSSDVSKCSIQKWIKSRERTRNAPKNAYLMLA